MSQQDDQAPDAGGAWQPPQAVPQPADAPPPPSAAPVPPPLPPSAYPPPAYPPPVPQAPVVGQPGYAQPTHAQPAYTPPQYAAPQYAPPVAGVPPYDPVGTAPAPGGWTPPPKPGLLPLRPLGFGALLWAPFRTLRRNPAPTFGSGLVVQLVTAIATVAVVLPFTLLVISRVESAPTADADPIIAGAVGGFLLLLIVPVALSIVAGAFLQGVMVVEVATGTLGEKLRFGELWRRAARRIWPLIGWTLIVGAVIVVAFALLAGVVALAAALGGAIAAGIAVVFAILAGLGLAVLGFWIGVKLSLVPSVIVLEQAGVRAAIVRSWRLTDGYFWRTLGVELLVAFILNTAANIVVQPISFIGGLVATLIDPTNAGAGLTVILVVSLVSVVITVLVGAVTAVVQAALIAVIYIDLRMRKEGLDVDLERFVEARDGGAVVSDPYLPQPTVPAPPAWA